MANVGRRSSAVRRVGQVRLNRPRKKNDACCVHSIILKSENLLLCVISACVSDVGRQASAYTDAYRRIKR